MRLIGLHGKPGAGKDTFADRLVERHRFIKRGFSDPLYEEVAHAFGVTVPWLQDRENKDTPRKQMALALCREPEFLTFVPPSATYYDPNTPRQVLQWWGTDYRRKQDPDYWLKKMGEFIGPPGNDIRGAGVVIRDVRTEAEAEWVRAHGGKIYEIVRPKLHEYHDHPVERRLPANLIDTTIWNAADVIWLKFSADFVGSMEAPL